MILNNTIHYKINSSGNKYKVVQIQCDSCESIKILPYYSYYKLKVHKCKKCASKGRNHFNRKGKTPSNFQIKCLVSCLLCDKSCFPKTKRQLNKSPRSFCNSSCQIKWQNQNTSFNKGINNPSYKHGQRVDGQLPNYGESFNKSLKRQVKVRDRYNCQRCFNNFSGKLSKHLDVHHIDSNKYNNEVSNLVCLCKSCHTKIHWQEGKL